MSTTQSHSHRYTCEYCNGPRTKEGVEGSYCSKECYHREQGQKLLNTIEYDHKHCSNCGTKVKEVEKPPKTFLVGKGRWTADAIIGFQYRTTGGEIGEIGNRTGTICSNCGNCTLSKPFPEMQRRFLFEYAQGILDTLREKQREGTHDKHIPHREFYEHLLETRDIAISLGRAID